MSEQNFNQSMKPFCGNSNATGLFIYSNYPGGVYTTSINSPSDPDLLNGKEVEGLMLAKNYKQHVKVNGMADDDVHNQYVDFIVRTALYHRELDMPTTLGSNLEGLKEAFKNAATEMLNRKFSDMARNPVSAGSVAVSQTYRSLNNFNEPNDSFFDVLTLSIIMKSLNGYTLDNLPGVCNNFQSTSPNSDLCAASWFVPSSGKSVKDHVFEFLNHNGHATNVLNNMFDDFNNEFRLAMEKYKELLEHELNLNAVSPADKANKVAVRRLLTQAQQRFKATLPEELATRMFAIAKPAMNAQADPKFTRVEGATGTQHSRDFYENIIGQWENLNSDARRFYCEHIQLRRKTAKSLGLTSAQAGWEEDISDKLYTDLSFVRNLPRNEVRINLKKERPGAEKVLFGQTLVCLPSKVKKLWYTSTRGVQSIDNPETEALRNIYHAVYMGQPAMVGGQPLSLPTQYSAVASRNADFDVNDEWVVRNLISDRKAAPVRMFAPAQIGNLLVEDMLTKITYYRDDNGLYRIDANGVKIPYSADIRTDNCAGSMLNGNSASCTKFVRECILNGDNDALMTCLNNLKDQNMFNVAYSELVNIDPEVARHILRTFKFKTNIINFANGTQKVEVQPFDLWKTTVLQNPAEISQQVRNAIEGNPKLCDYLKGVVSFINSNPAILNPNWREGSVQEAQQITDPYVNALKRKLWINPRPEDMKYNDSKMLLGAFATPVFGMPVPGRLINPFANTVIGNGQMFYPARTMLGGGNSYEDTLSGKINEHGKIGKKMEELFYTVGNDLRKAGYSLTHADLIKIENSCDELNKTEDRLNELHGMLRTLTDLNSLFKASGCVPHEYVGNVSIDNLKNRKDTLTYLKQNINDIQNCINNNISNQNSKCNELVKYYSALVDVAAGKGNSGVVRIGEL